MYVLNLIRSMNAVHTEIIIRLVLWKNISCEKTVLLIEGTHYMRREDQPSLSPHPFEAIVDCIFCQELLTAAVGNKRKCNNDGRGYRLDKLQHHLKSVHTNELIDGNVRTLFDVGFLREDDGLTCGFVGGEVSRALPQGQSAQGHANGASSPVNDHDASAEIIPDVLGHQFWRLFRQRIDAIIKVNASAKVIHSAEAIAKEVIKQHMEQETQQNGSGVLRERWMDHRNEVDMAMDAGLTYESNEEGERVIHCPICAEFGDSILGKLSRIKPGRRTCDMRKAIGNHLHGRMHADTLEESEKELRQDVRRTRIELNIAGNVALKCSGPGSRVKGTREV